MHFCDVVFFCFWKVFKVTFIHYVITNDFKNIFEHVGRLLYSCFLFYAFLWRFWRKNVNFLKSLSNCMIITLRFYRMHTRQEGTWLDIKTILALAVALNFMKTQIFAKMTPKMTKSPKFGRIFSSKFRRGVEISIGNLFFKIRRLF